MELVYKNEKMLFPIMLAISVLAWLAIVLGTLGAVLLYAFFFFIAYCFAQSALISHIKGNGVLISEQQYPELKRQISACCEKLGLAPEPQAYLMQEGGAMNAFATRFFGRDFIVLYSEVVDSLAENPDALNFYIGHEIGHIKRKHLKWGTVLLPASILPLVGAAYARSREYTCDRHGLAACDNPVNAEHGLAALAAGGKRWRTMNRPAFAGQSQQTEGFWMSFHELTGSYPWLVKRMGAVRALAAGQEVTQPRRHFGAGLLALFVPRLGFGGSAAGAIVMFAIIGVLAAVAIPAYQDYQHKAQLAQAYAAGQDAADKVGRYIGAHGALPASLDEAGVRIDPANRAVEQMELNQDEGALAVLTRVVSPDGQGRLVFAVAAVEKNGVKWTCSAQNLRPQLLPPACR